MESDCSGLSSKLSVKRKSEHGLNPNSQNSQPNSESRKRFCENSLRFSYRLNCFTRTKNGCGATALRSEWRNLTTRASRRLPPLTRDGVSGEMSTKTGILYGRNTDAYTDV